MQVAIYVPFVLTAILGVGAGSIARALAPSTAARTLTVAAAVAAATSVASLLVLAAVGVAELAALLHAEDATKLLSGRELIADPAAVAAPLLCSWCLIEILRAAAAARRAYQTADRALAGLPGPPGSSSVAADEDPYAFAIAGGPGRPGRIVVSTAMLSALDPDQRRVLFAHEHAHLRHRHHHYRWIARLAGTNPLLRRLPHRIDHALERWADEEAARRLGDRALVAQALGTAALAGPRPNRPELPITPLEFARCGVADRMAALLAPPARTQRHILVATTILALTSVSANLDAVQDLIGLMPGG